jgi:hypothetical protein
VVSRQAQFIDLLKRQSYAEIDSEAGMLVGTAKRSAGHRAACEVNGARGERTTRVATSGSNLASASYAAARRPEQQGSGTSVLLA